MFKIGDVLQKAIMLMSKMKAYNQWLKLEVTGDEESVGFMERIYSVLKSSNDRSRESWLLMSDRHNLDTSRSRNLITSATNLTNTAPRFSKNLLRMSEDGSLLKYQRHASNSEANLQNTSICKPGPKFRLSKQQSPREEVKPAFVLRDHSPKVNRAPSPEQRISEGIGLGKIVFPTMQCFSKASSFIEVDSPPKSSGNLITSPSKEHDKVGRRFRLEDSSPRISDSSTKNSSPITNIYMRKVDFNFGNIQQQELSEQSNNITNYNSLLQNKDGKKRLDSSYQGKQLKSALVSPKNIPKKRLDAKV